MGNQYEEDNDEEGLAFARKYRPQKLDDYVGNRDVKETVFRYLRNRRRPQTILLHGNTGCGKTTLSRILIKEYMCPNRDPEKGACGVCPTCLSFEEYIRTGKTDSVVDVYEIDASDKSGKKDIDAILESMEYPAMGGDWKAYLLDEAHLLSEGAMGRLLKSIEEPPEGVLILISTTDPDKLLDTVRNRCEVKLGIIKPTTSELMGHLRNICKIENKDFDLEGLRMICGRSDNVIRDSLNNLETVLNTRGDAKAISVSEQFHQVTDKVIYDFYKAYVNDDYVSYLGVLYRIKTEYSFNQFLASLLTFTTRGIYILNSIEVDSLTKEEIESMLKLFSQFDVKDLCRILSELKRMPSGNIEANLMAFIYCKNDDYLSRSNEKVIEVSQTTTTSEETKFRNNNLQRIQEGLLNEGVKSASNQMGNATFDDIQSLFSIEKVIQD